MNHDGQLVRDGNTLYLQGKVGFQTVNRLYRTFQNELNEEITALDCSKVEQCDSSALGLLLASRGLAASRQIKLQIRGINEQLKSLARLYEVEALLI